MIKLIEKIVFSGVNGTILIIPLIILIYVTFGQVQEFITIAKKYGERRRIDGFSFKDTYIRSRNS